MSESNNLNEIKMNLPKGTHVFRNNVAVAWVGKMVKVNATDVLLRFARPLHAGLFKGSGDLIGVTEIIITPEMVGRKMGIFTSIETKTEKGVKRKEQIHWRDFLVNAGCIALFATSSDDLKKEIEDFKNKSVDIKD